MWSLMPRIALYIYMGFYLYHSVSIVVEDIKDKEPLWIIRACRRTVFGTGPATA